MTKEDKDLLLRDLSARLPYGFIVHRYSDNVDIKINTIDDFSHFLEYSNDEKFKPYLRTISSMTEEEDKKRIELGIWINTIKGNKVTAIDKNVDEALDWLNKKMFAYRTIDGKDMFELGLAIEAPKGMYK
jgi:hypothetical protein